MKQSRRLILFTFIFLLTPIRGAVLVLMPLIPFYLKKMFNLSIDIKRFATLMVLMLISSVGGVFSGWIDIENALLSFWLLPPVLWLLLAHPQVPNHTFDYTAFLKTGLYTLLVVDGIGFINYVILGGNTFATAYGEHYEVVHGLAMCNAMFCCRYIAKILHKVATKKDYLVLMVLAYAFVLCDFGLGWLTAFAAILIYFMIHGNVKSLSACIAITVGFSYLLTTESFEYERQNIEYTQETQDNARKALMFSELPNVVSDNPMAVFTGFGPGGFNSRQCILMSDHANNPFTKVLGEHNPHYYKKYIYPLWNTFFVSQGAYTDGTRNKPFSSFVGMLFEEGFVFGIIVMAFWIKRIRFYKKREYESVEYGTLLLLNIFMLVACVVHEWLVSSEFLLFIFLEYAYKQRTLNNKTATV